MTYTIIVYCNILHNDIILQYHLQENEDGTWKEANFNPEIHLLDKAGEIREFRAWCLGFEVWGLGVVWGLGFGV